VSACEKCWSDAFLESRITNEHQADAYQRLLVERRDNPCTLAQQFGEEE